MVDEHNQELLSLLRHLGDLLVENPIRAGTGEYEPVYEKPRLYSDVEAEMANRLTNVPNFQAWCVLVEGTQLRGYEMRTDPPTADLDAEVEVHIRQRSKQMARPRSEVEKSTQGRMAKGVPPITFYE